MTRTKIAFLVAAASTLALTADGGNAASLSPATGVKESAAMLPAHMCHFGCRYGPMMTPHRHRLFSCAPTQCIDWGRLWGEPLLFKRRRSH
jgi:hypothetical protein